MAWLITREHAIEQLSKVLKPFKKYKGVTVPRVTLSQEELEKQAAQIILEPSDVWITTLPKAGTSWAQQIVKLIRNGAENDGKTISESVPWFEGNALLKIDFGAMPRPRAFKSHFSYDLMPFGRPDKTPCKYIYVARNPKDVAVSFYFHHCRYHALPGVHLDWNLFFCNFLYGNLSFGDYFDHVLSWWAHRNDDNVLFLKYEDMKRDLPAAVLRIAKFIECEITDQILAKVVAMTTFDAMKRDDMANHSWSNHRINPGSTPFMRKGEVGDWKNHFTPDQSAELDRIYQERLSGSGLGFEFDFVDTKTCMILQC